MAKRGRLLVFTGDGKGKTTAALGMALRAAGHGMAVVVLQFCKADSSTGEIAACDKLPTVRVVQGGPGFVPKKAHPDFPKHRKAAEETLAKARELLSSGELGMVVLDEICVAVAHGLLDEDAVLDALENRSDDTIVVLTGRGATPRMIGLADTVSEIRCVKHGLDAGHGAQEGVER